MGIGEKIEDFLCDYGWVLLIILCFLVLSVGILTVVFSYTKLESAGVPKECLKYKGDIYTYECCIKCKELSISYSYWKYNQKIGTCWCLDKTGKPIQIW